MPIFREIGCSNSTLRSLGRARCLLVTGRALPLASTKMPAASGKGSCLDGPDGEIAK